MKKLSGKVAVITGGGTGIGLATAKRFVAEGAKVFITGRRSAELDKAVAEIGGSVIAVQNDVTNLGDLDRLFAEVKGEAGKLDVIYTNAGTGALAPLGSITEEHYEREFNTTVKGTLRAGSVCLSRFSGLISGASAGFRPPRSAAGL